MREVLYEESANPNNMKLQKTIYIIYSVFFWISIAAIIFLTMFILFIAFDLGILILDALIAGSTFLIWFLKTKIYYCVDYIFVTGSTRIIKVVNFKRRKKIIIFEANEVKTIGRLWSDTFEKLSSTPSVKKIFATPNKYPEEGFYVLVNQDGIDHLVIMECKETFLQHLVAFTGKNVIEKDYK